MEERTGSKIKEVEGKKGSKARPKQEGHWEEEQEEENGDEVKSREENPKINQRMARSSLLHS